MGIVPKAVGHSGWLVILPPILQLCALKPAQSKSLTKATKLMGGRAKA